MTKYARLVDYSVAQDGSDIRAVDVFDPAAYNPRPSWGQTDAALLGRIFSNHYAEWVAAGQWFVAVPDGTQNGAVKQQDGSFKSPTLPIIDTPPDGTSDYRGTLLAQANEAEAKGDITGALLLRAKAGE